MDVDGLINQVVGFQIADDDSDEQEVIIPLKEIVWPRLDFRWAILRRFLIDQFIQKNEMSHFMTMN